MKYLDLVELIEDMPQYSQEGVLKGMFGAVMSEQIINGKCNVLFSEFYTGKDIAQINVDIKHLKVHQYVPLDKYPKK